MTEIYACEKETKQIIIYDVVNNTHYRRDLDNIEKSMNLMSNFQYCIIGGRRLFVVGGGDFKKVESPSLTSCIEILVA